MAEVNAGSFAETQREALQRLAVEFSDEARTQVADLLPVIPTLPGLSTRGFGIEIEIAGPCTARDGGHDPRSEDRDEERTELVRLLNVAGIMAREGRYSEFDEKFWLIKVDQSCGLEVVSPPLYGKNGTDTIRQVCAVL